MHEQGTSIVTDQPPRHPRVAAGGRGPDGRDRGRRRGDAAHRVGPLDRRVEAGHRRPAAARRAGLAGRIRQVQGHSAIPRTQCGNEPRGFQDDLLVGVDASRAGAAGRRRVPASAALVPVARPGRAAPARPAADHLLPRRRARRGRLVDGRLRAERPRQRVAISAGVPPDAGLRHLRRRAVDRAEPDHARAGRRAGAGSVRARWCCSVS